MIELTGYQILDRIYSGTRTLVYRGTRTCDETPVVIKVLRSEYPSFSELVQFRNQYTIAKNLNLPGIIQTYSLEAYQNGYALIVEDFGGISLKEWTGKGKAVPSLVEFLLIAIDLCTTLDVLCRDRIIHKDIKPANILINPTTKQIKLIDFSIASLLPRETQTLMNPNVLEGTLNYLSPEQTGRMNRGIDYRTDFYSLGVTFYELLTGQLPFSSSDPMELIHCHIAKQPPSVHQINPEIPVVLSSIVSKLMAKNAENRYQSALGLKADLENCLQQLNETGKIESFVIGQRDLCDRFIIPEKLYGRATEVATLLAAFDRVANPLLSRGGAPVPARWVEEANSSRSEMMLVAGFSGIGKTVVVNEIHKPIVRQRGYFIKGKYDQFQRNIPFSAFVQAFRDLMGQLLSESDSQLNIWKTKILEVVGDNGQVLIDVIPELELIIGKQPPATELSGTSAQNRFNLLIQNFINIFASQEHPLVMFIDDLQWSDSASQNLLKLLMQDTKYLLVLGAYRDNEVSPIHPFILTVDEIIKTGAVVQTMTLQALSLEDTNQLVADTLNCELSLAQPLTKLVYQKTKGNPFFATQFLKALHDDKLISFDSSQSSLDRGRRQGGWQCDISQVLALALTDDVVEFMALQLQKLPTETQNMLKLAACIGAEFDLNTLAIVSEKSAGTTATDLWKALQEGLVIPTTKIYKFFTQAEGEESFQTTANPTYRFLHDRVQQAAYSLIPDDQKQATHLNIGQLIRSSTAEADLETNTIFEIVGHLNISSDLITQTDQKIDLAQLNLIAGNKAKAANAYEPALTYCRTGLALLEDLGGWQNQTSLMLALHEGAAAAAYLCGDFAQMEQWVSAILAQNLEHLDRVKTYEIQIQAHSTQGQFSEAIAIAQNALKQFNIHLPKQPTPADIVPAMQDIAALLNGRTAHDLLDLPVMTDAVSLASMQLLSSISPASYISAPLLFPFVVLAQVKLSIQSGNTALSAYSYSCYAVLLSGVLEDLDGAYEFGQLGLELASKFKVQTVQPRVNFIVGTFIIHCKSHCRNSLPLLTEAFKIGLEVGDFEFTGYSAAYRCQFSYAVGKELTTLLAEIEISIATFLKLNIFASSNHNSTVFQTTIQRLQSTRNEAVLTTQKELHKTLTISNDLTGLHFYWVYRLTASYLLNEMVEAKQDAAEARQTLAAGVGMMSIPIFYFYDSLTALADFSEVTDKTAVLDRISANQTKLYHRAYHAPMNFKHKYDLVEAEKHRVLGNKAEAIELYDKAISGAQENQFLNEEALANELAAKFYLDWGKEKIAQSYMIDAYYAYSRWGAKAKVQDLEIRYEQLLTPILQKPAALLTASESISSSFKTLLSVHHTVSTSSSTSTISQMLDIATVLKAAQSLYGAIEMDELLSSLMQVVMENAGADKSILILNKDGNLEIVAQSFIDSSSNLQTIPLDNCQDLPVNVIYYVKRTQETVISTADNTIFASDLYLMQEHPQSFLCTPIINQGKLIGILYLENLVTAGAFTADRIELLKLLCSQAAISLENARLYQKSQQALENLQQAQLQLIQSEKMSALGNLVAGVAHEINNPVGFLKGNLKPAMDGIQDLFGLIDIYQQEYPDQTTAIQDEIEAIDLDFLRADLPNLVGSMAEGIDRICNISVSLRTFSRADSDRPLPFNIHEGIDSTILILKHRLKASESRPSIEILKDYGNLPAIECYAGQLNQVFMNFLANAIDALEDSNSGRSYQEIEANPNRIAITTTVSEDKKSIIIRIKDNGIGMSESVQEQIFEHLFTTKAVGKGTGLGLAIARQIVVEKHQGAIEVNSVLGEGTEFVISLPAKALTSS
jgi:predicted ATPase/signal transduction histidine kinase